MPRAHTGSMLSFPSSLARTLRLQTLCLALVLLWSGRPSLAGALCPLPIAETVRVTGATDDGSLALADGRSLRLANVRADATVLRRELNGRTITLAYEDRATDRYARLVAQAFDGADGRWIQERLVGSGVAIVMPSLQARKCVRPLLAAEAQARAERRGVWQDPQSRVRSPEDLRDAAGSFRIVEGRIQGVLMARERVYANFGDDYRSDLTLTVPRRSMKLFLGNQIQPAAWQGRRLRVRGWVSSLNGPEIEVTHPEQLEWLD